MEDIESIIFDISADIEKLEDETASIEHQIELKKADYIENRVSYSPVWMAKASHALKKKRIEIGRLKLQKSQLQKELNGLVRLHRQDAFVSNLKRLLLEKYSEDSIRAIFKKADSLTMQN